MGSQGSRHRHRGVPGRRKSPGWEGEITAEQRKAGRLKQPKWVESDSEGGARAPWERLRFAIDKAYKKLRDDVPNLLVVADDLFISIEHCLQVSVPQALYVPGGYFTDQRYERLGGVGIFWIDQELGKSEVGYHMRVFLNPNALPATALPRDMQDALKRETLEG